MTGALDILQAIRQADSAFPSGGFAFSQGLEALSIAGPMDAERLGDVMRAALVHRWAPSDRVALVRGHRLAPDLDRLLELDLEIEASTPVEALRSGSRRNGLAVLTAHARLGQAVAQTYRAEVLSGAAPGHLAIAQALAWTALGLDERLAGLVSGYQCMMALATAAVRLGISGAIEAQSVVGANLALLERLMEEEIDDAQEMSSFMPAIEVALMSRAANGQRLFAN